MLIAYGGGSAIALGRARQSHGGDRRASVLIGIGLGSAGVGVSTIAVLEATGYSVPAFSPIDLFFIATYFFVTVGALSLPNAFGGPRDVARTIIDGVVGALSIGTLAWVYGVGDLLEYYWNASSWSKWMGTAYPLLDIVTIILFVTLLSRRSQYRMDPRLILMSIGVGLQAAGDLSYLHSSLGTTAFADADPKFYLLVGGATMFAMSAYLGDKSAKPREYVERSAHIFGVVAPYAIAAVLVVATLVSLPYAGFDSVSRLLTITTVIVGVLIIVRQSLAIYDNRIHVDQKRTDLVASISHEMRTPLTAVIGFLDLIRSSEYSLSPEETTELTTMAHREATRMARIVADILLLSTYTPGEMTLVEEPSSIHGLVLETLETIEAGSTEVALIVDKTLRATIDPLRIQQVLVNLIENAIRYGHGKVQVRAYSLHGRLILEVHDNGNGVPKEYQNTIWKRFERGANRFNAAIPGSGIGLAVVAAITAAYRGMAEYRQSEDLKGACFRIELPTEVFTSDTANEPLMRSSNLRQGLLATRH